MAIDVGFMSMLQSLAPGVPVEQGTVSDEKLDPRIYFARTGEVQETDLDGTPGLTETTFAVEVGGTDIDVVQQWAQTIRRSLNGTRGALASGEWALACTVEDASDDYQPLMLNADVGYHVASFQVKFMY